MWVREIDLLERVAKYEVIRGYFSDEDDVSAQQQQCDDLNYSSLKLDL